MPILIPGIRVIPGIRGFMNMTPEDSYLATSENDNKEILLTGLQCIILYCIICIVLSKDLQRASSSSSAVLRPRHALEARA